MAVAECVWGVKVLKEGLWRFLDAVVLTRFEAGSPFLSRERTETPPKLHSGTAPELRSSRCSNKWRCFPSIASRGCNPTVQRPAQGHPTPNLITLQSFNLDKLKLLFGLLKDCFESFRWSFVAIKITLGWNVLSCT